jgi:hypothetical protein
MTTVTKALKKANLGISRFDEQKTPERGGQDKNCRDTNYNN